MTEDKMRHRGSSERKWLNHMKETERVIRENEWGPYSNMGDGRYKSKKGRLKTTDLI